MVRHGSGAPPRAFLGDMLDLGMLMYAGLLVLALWRCICFYRCCGLWLSFLNYTSLLYLILAASLTYAAVEFYGHANEPLITGASPDADVWGPVPWLRPFVLGAPVSVALCVILGWFQTEGHVFEIHKDLGTLKHDRAVQIIALPSVFAVMAMASMVPICELVTGRITAEMLAVPFGIDIRTRFGHLQTGTSVVGGASFPELGNATDLALASFGMLAPGGGNETMGMLTPWDQASKFAMWRYETCFYVADLFEAWALYQFGLLALELIRESFARQEMSEHEVERHSARELLAAHSAVSSLAWLGTMSFVVVCVGQTACSLYPYVGGGSEGQGNMMLGFQVAGFIASGVALYNVFVVERAFHAHLSPSSPLLKFLSVKILVSLSFSQRGVLVLLQNGNRMMPHTVQRLAAYVPILGHILNMTEVQLHLFYPALIQYECFLTTLMHFWAWGASESWYQVADVPDAALDPERQPLLKKGLAVVDGDEGPTGVPASYT